MNRLMMAAVSAVLLAAGCGGSSGTDWKERFFPPPVATQLVRIESDRPDDRREALQTVAADSGARQLPSVVKVFCLVAKSDKDPMVRSAAVRGLAVMAGEEVAPTLGAVATRDESPYVRMDACGSLGRQKEAGAAAPLMEVLCADRIADVRVAAADALRNFKDKAVVKALVTALDDSSLAVSRNAWESLRYMTGQNMPRKAEAWGDFLANSENPFELYGKPPAMPKGANQRPQFTKGPAEFIRDLFKTDPQEAELN